MPIAYDADTNIFKLSTKHSDYQFMVGQFGFLLHLYYGATIGNQNMDYLIHQADRGFCMNSYDAGGDRTFSPDCLPLEYPTEGIGDYRNSAAAVINSDGSRVLDLRYQSHKISPGKYTVDGMPSLYEEIPGEAETLTVTLIDSISSVEVKLLYGVFADKDIITRATVFRNLNGNDVQIKKAQSLNVDFLYGAFDLIHFHGRHAMEREFERIPVMHGVHTLGSSRGTSSHQQNPGFILAEPDATEDYGDCYGFNLVYSGNFGANIERGQIGQTRVNVGLGGDDFHWTLLSGESFATPEAVMSFSGQGLARLSHNFHKAVRHNVCRGEYKLSPHPILINNWEATYFDFTGEKLLQIAKDAKTIGAEMLVMDDGWFGDRMDDNRALGDWFVNEKKLGRSLKELADSVNKIGLKFGIWIEPEMVNENSELYREHKDWALQIPGRNPVRGRNQLVLDLSRNQVCVYLYEQICAVLDSANVEYVKWDMNRSITDWYSPLLSDAQQSELPHRYVLGLYDLMKKLTERYPHLLFEGCSGGGGRFDLAMLSFQPQIWCSDNTDAINRLKIQYGTGFFYPISSVGSHVSVSPNHQTGRSCPLATRAAVAMAGSFGYELDVTKMTEAEKTEAQGFTEQYKKYQNLISSGLYYRLKSPYDTDGITAWQFASEDGSEALLTVVGTDVQATPVCSYIKLKGLCGEKIYSINGVAYTGAALMNAGFKVLPMSGDYPAEIYYFKAQ
jgi:alpha-galactosidase